MSTPQPRHPLVELVEEYREASDRVEQAYAVARRVGDDLWEARSRLSKAVADLLPHDRGDTPVAIPDGSGGFWLVVLKPDLQVTHTDDARLPQQP